MLGVFHLPLEVELGGGGRGRCNFTSCCILVGNSEVERKLGCRTMESVTSTAPLTAGQLTADRWTPRRGEMGHCASPDR